MICKKLASLTRGLLLLAASAASSSVLAGQNSAPVLLYHHVSTQTPASTSVSPQTFAEHMAYIARHHKVVPLSEIVSAAQEGTTLPDNALAITFDDGYVDILNNAHPVLQDHGFPYTVFINPDAIDSRADQLTWQQVQRMAKENVTFANHTLEHLHLLNRMNDESEDAWLERVWNNIEQAQHVIASHLENAPKYLAYPFGEFNQRLAQKVEDAGYTGFGQHSGAVGPQADFAALPRFPAAGPYANLKSLKTKMNSLALPVSETSVSNPELQDAEPPIEVALTIQTDDVQLKQATCYFQGEAINTSVKNDVLKFTVNKALPTGRSRVNCTAPSQSRSGKYYWYSQPFFIADEDGNYPD